MELELYHREKERMNEGFCLCGKEINASKRYSGESFLKGRSWIYRQEKRESSSTSGGGG